MTLAIRVADPLRDAAGCAAIYAPFVADGWVSFEVDPPGADEIARRMGKYGASHLWLVAEIGGVVAGYAYGSPHAERAAYLHSCDVAVYVDPAHARKGIGRALYNVLLPVLAKKGFHAAFAAIALPNEGSVGLHEALGFEPVGIFREVGWKFDGLRDVGWWQMLL